MQRSVITPEITAALKIIRMHVHSICVLHVDLRLIPTLMRSGSHYLNSIVAFSYMYGPPYGR